MIPFFYHLSDGGFAGNIRTCNIWKYMEIYLEIYIYIWKHMEIYGNIWKYMEILYTI